MDSEITEYKHTSMRKARRSLIAKCQDKGRKQMGGKVIGRRTLEVRGCVTVWNRSSVTIYRNCLLACFFFTVSFAEVKGAAANFRQT